MDSLKELLSSNSLEDRVLALRMIGDKLEDHKRIMISFFYQDEDKWFVILPKKDTDIDVAVIVSSEVGYILKNRYYILVNYSLRGAFSGTYGFVDISNRSNIINFHDK